MADLPPSDFPAGSVIDGWFRLAMSYPETVASGACTRTAVKVRKKGFIYLGLKGDEYNALFKLGPSLDEAAALAAEAPARFQVGKTGWVTVRFPLDATPPEGLMARWMEESFRLSAPKSVLTAWEAARS